MTLPTVEELNDMRLGELQEAALIFETELGVDIDRSARKADLLAALLKNIPNEDQETVSEPETPNESENEESEEESESEPEVAVETVEVVEPTAEVEEIIEKVTESIDETPAEEETPVEEAPVEEETPVEESTEEPTEDLYYTERGFNDWESGWDYDPYQKNISPKPIDNMTPGLETAIAEGIVKKV